jgi:hypothetical protein
MERQFRPSRRLAVAADVVPADSAARAAAAVVIGVPEDGVVAAVVVGVLAALVAHRAAAAEIAKPNLNRRVRSPAFAPGFRFGLWISVGDSLGLMWRVVR